MKLFDEPRWEELGKESSTDLLGFLAIMGIAIARVAMNVGDRFASSILSDVARDYHPETVVPSGVNPIYVHPPKAQQRDPEIKDEIPRIEEPVPGEHYTVRPPEGIPAEAPEYQPGAPSKPIEPAPQKYPTHQEGLVSMPFPQKSETIFSLYGPRIHPINRTNSFHKGVDIGMRAGTPLLATQDGTVSYYRTDPSRASGLAVGIRIPGSPYIIVYMHMSRIDVKQGQKVKAGQQLGLSGNTGASTGPHLHFQICTPDFKDCIDPVPYLQYLADNVGGVHIKTKDGKPLVTADRVRAPQPESVPQKTNTSTTVSPQAVTVQKQTKHTTSSGKYKSMHIGIAYESTHEDKFHNPLGIKAATEHSYKGQNGFDMADKRARHASFTDPYYAILAAVKDPAQCFNWDASRFTQSSITRLQTQKTDVNGRNWVSGKIYHPWPPLYGLPAPQVGKNLYHILCHYAPACNKNCTPPAQGPFGRASKIVGIDPAAWPQGIHTPIVDGYHLTRGQFNCFIRVTAWGEQHVAVDDWYLDMCYDAIHGMGPEPTQEFLSKHMDVVRTHQSASYSNNYNNKQ